MDICGEHGSDIAFSGRDCPACDNVDGVRSDAREELDAQIGDFEFTISELEEKIYELENK